MVEAEESAGRGGAVSSVRGVVSGFLNLHIPSGGQVDGTTTGQHVHPCT